MQKQENFFLEGHQSTFWIKMPFGIGHPPPTHQLQSTCVGEGSRVPNLQTEFNYLDSFKSYGIFSDFIVPGVPVIPMSSLCHPRHPHIIPIGPRRSPCGPHGCGLHPMLSPWSPLSPCHPHVIPIIPTSSLCHPCCPHVVPIAPRRSPCGPYGCGLCGLRCLCGLHPMLSPWSPWSPLSPCHPCHPHVISMSSPCHLQGPHIIPTPPETHSTHSLPPGRWRTSNQ